MGEKRQTPGKGRVRQKKLKTPALRVERKEKSTVGEKRNLRGMPETKNQKGQLASSAFSDTGCLVGALGNSKGQARNESVRCVAEKPK